jgi:hypothetical protein
MDRVGLGEVVGVAAAAGRRSGRRPKRRMPTRAARAGASTRRLRRVPSKMKEGLSAPAVVDLVYSE